MHGETERAHGRGEYQGRAQETHRATLTLGARAFVVAMLVVAMLLAAPVVAHPPISIVRDADGNVFYSDLAQVWRIAPDGTKSVAVPGVHTHELALDAAGNLYGEHLWYEGEKTDRWGHRVWVRHPDGRIEDVYPARTGFRTDYQFTRDAKGNHFWIDRGNPSTVRRRTFDVPGGREAVVATLPPAIDGASLSWIMVAPEGTVYFTAANSLYRVSGDGAVRPLAAHVSGSGTGRPPSTEKYAVMGLWLDAEGRLYAAAYGDGTVKRVSPSGKVETFAESSWPWAPTGGVFAPNGDLYLLETSKINAVRVRRIAVVGGASHVF